MSFPHAEHNTGGCRCSPEQFQTGTDCLRLLLLLPYSSHNQYVDYSATFRGDLQAPKRRKRRKKKYSFIETEKPCTQRRQECWHSRTVSRHSWHLTWKTDPYPTHPPTYLLPQWTGERGRRERRRRHQCQRLSNRFPFYRGRFSQIKINELFKWRVSNW